MSTDPKPDPFAEPRNLLSENARLRARVEVLEYREKIGDGEHGFRFWRSANENNTISPLPMDPPDLLYGDQSHAVYPESEARTWATERTVPLTPDDPTQAP